MLNKILIWGGGGLVLLILAVFLISQYGSTREKLGYERGFNEGNQEALKAAREASRRLENIRNEVEDLTTDELDSLAIEYNIMREDEDY